MKFFRNVLGTFFTEILIVGFNFLAGVLLARWLAVEERGLLALLMLLPVTLAYFIDIGVSQSIVYLVGRKQASPTALASTTLVLAAVSGSLSAVLLWLARPWLLSTFFRGVPEREFGLVLMLLPLLAVDTYLLSFLRAQWRFGAFNARRLLPPFLLVLGIIFLVGGLGWGLRGALVAFIASLVLPLIIAFWLVGSRIPLRLGFDPRLAGAALGFGAKSYLQNLVGHLHYRLDVYLLALFLPAEQVAFYAVATSMAEVAFYIPNSVGMVLFPRLSAEPDERIHLLTAEACRHTLWVSAAASLGILAVGWWLIPAVYGVDYRPAVAPFIALLPGILAMTLYKVLTRNYTSRNKQQVSILAAGIALGLNVVLNLILIPRMGVMGAALASLLSYSASALVLVVVFLRETGLPVSQLLILRRSDLKLYEQAFAQVRFPRRGLLQISGDR